jgi:hypothetical protein
MSTSLSVFILVLGQDGVVLDSIELGLIGTEVTCAWHDVTASLLRLFIPLVQQV